MSLRAPVLLVSALTLAGCTVRGEPGPTATAHLDAGDVDLVKASITMRAGEFWITGGGVGLLDASFRYSRNVGTPDARYRIEDRIGRLEVDASPASTSVATSKLENDWRLRFGGRTPLELDVHLGAGESRLDLTALPLRRLDVHLGAGSLTLRLGPSDRNVDVNLTGGVGEAIIKVPASQSVVATATGGIGSIDTKNFDRREGRYYTRAFDPSKPTIAIRARGGVGSIEMEAE